MTNFPIGQGICTISGCRVSPNKLTAVARVAYSMVATMSWDLLYICVLGVVINPVGAQYCAKVSWSAHPNKGLSGHNAQHYAGNLEFCKYLCNAYDWCLSIDYHNNANACDLAGSGAGVALTSNSGAYSHYRIEKRCAAGTQLPSCTPCAAGKREKRTTGCGANGCPGGTFTPAIPAGTCPVGGDRRVPDCYQGCLNGNNMVGLIFANYQSAAAASPQQLPVSTGAVCVSCAAGRWSAAGQSQFEGTLCDECATGQYSAAGAATCIVCPAGKRGPVAAAASCISCIAGRFAASTGMTSCSDCSAGQYSAAGASTCIQCEAGKYHNQPQVSACIACVVGYYASNTGSQSCTLCSGEWCTENNRPP